MRRSALAPFVVGALALALLGAVMAGCEASSKLAPDEPLAALDGGERAQLCRFTVDLLGDAAWGCTGEAPPAALVDFDACLAAPPWSDLDGDVGAWEDCVNATNRDPCAADACAP